MAIVLGTCRGCGAQIAWVRMASGKNMPCDAAVKRYWPDPAGPEKIVTQFGDVVNCRFTGSDDDATDVGYISHFATCPKAGQFKRTRATRS